MMNTNSSGRGNGRRRAHFLTLGAQMLMFFLKRRVTKVAVLPADPTGDATIDNAKSVEFQRLVQQYDAKYENDRSLLTDLEPMIYEFAEAVADWMETRDMQMGNQFGQPGGQGGWGGNGGGGGNNQIRQPSWPEGTLLQQQIVGEDGKLYVNPAVVAVRGGKICWVTNPAVATREFGAGWASLIQKTTFDAFDNMLVGPSIR